MARLDFVREMLDRSADGAYIVDQDQRIAAWNKSAEKILGFKAQEIVGMNCFAVLGGHIDGGCVVCRRGCLPFTAGRRGELVPTFDAQMRTASGYPLWVNVTIIAMPTTDGSDEPDVIVHFFREVEAKKRAETFAKDVAGWVRQLQLEVPQPGMPGARPCDVGLTEREIQVLRQLSHGSTPTPSPSSLSSTGRPCAITSSASCTSWASTAVSRPSPTRVSMVCSTNDCQISRRVTGPIMF